MIEQARKLFLVFCLLFLTMSGCGAAEDNVETLRNPIRASGDIPPSTQSTYSVDPSKVQETSIDFRLLYRGFTAINIDDSDAYSRFNSIGTCIIDDESAWQDFMDNFCPGIWYFEEFSFDSDILLASIGTLARPSMSVLFPVETVILNENGCLEFQNSTDLNKRIYALNTANTTHFDITIAIISREELSIVPNNTVYGS